MKRKFEIFCKDINKGEREAAKLFYKIAEAYILMEVYHLNINCILNEDEEYLNQLKRISIYNLYF